MKYKLFLVVIFCVFVIIRCTCYQKQTYSLEEVINSIPDQEIDSINYAIIKDYAIFDEKDGLMNNTSGINSNSLMRVFDYEKKLLSDWETLPEYIKTKPQFISDSIIQNNDSIFPSRCGAFDKSSINALRTPGKASGRTIDFFLFEFSKIEIPVIVHVINNDSGYMMYDSTNENPKILIEREHINEQFQVLNQAFSPHRIEFKIDSIITHNNSDWNESGMHYYSKSTLDKMLYDCSVTPESHLNLYIIDGRKTGRYMLGEATFPWDVTSGKYDDYVVISCRTIPGVFSNPDWRAGEGKTLIHEVGHYLGLYHTFEGNSEYCDDPDENAGCYYGDKVDDTPPQKICIYGECDNNGTEYNTCQEEGNDPVDNFMGYNDDECMERFTKGQITRIFKAVYFHRDVYFKTEKPSI